MGVVLSCCGALACSCCIGASCQCAGYALSMTKSIATRLMYTIVFLLISVVAFCFKIYAYDILSHIPFVEESCTEDTCGTFSVYRLTFALFLFHGLLSVLFIGIRSTKDPRALLNDGWWPLKLPLLLAVIVGCFFIPNEFFTYYAWVAIIGAGLFILIQLVLLIDFAYSWSESWVSKWQDDTEGGEERIYLYGLLSVTGLLFLIALLFDILMYTLFCRDGCWWNSLLITANLIMCLFLSVMSILPRVQEFNPRAGLLQASIFSVYCTYYVYSAILSEPTCGQLTEFAWASSDSTTSDWLSLVFGGLFTVISVVYASVRAGSSTSLKQRDYDEEPFLTSTERKEEPLEEDDEEEDQDDERKGTAYSYSLFHLAFALGAMYIGMLLTNWSVITGDTGNLSTDSGWVSVSVKLFSCLFAGALYLWTVLAPMLLPDRDWDL